MFYSMSEEKESLNLSIDASVKLAMKVYATGAREDVSAITERLYRAFLVEHGINVANVEDAVAKVAEDPPAEDPPNRPAVPKEKSKRIGFERRHPNKIFIAPNRWGTEPQEAVLA